MKKFEAFIINGFSDKVYMEKKKIYQISFKKTRMYEKN